MPKPPAPPDLSYCTDCGKMIGPHEGWFGAECQCGQAPGDALRGAQVRGLDGRGDGAALAGLQLRIATTSRNRTVASTFPCSSSMSMW
jgi:hypothetical protein